MSVVGTLDTFQKEISYSLPTIGVGRTLCKRAPRFFLGSPRSVALKMAALSALALCLLFLLSSLGVSEQWSGDGKPPGDPTKESPDEGGTNHGDASPTTQDPGLVTSPNTTASTPDHNE